MTSVSPPTYYFDGITFNSAFYTTSSSGGLTEAQANALYLKKNTADTATALETFTGGVITNSIDTSTLASNMTIGKLTNTGTISIQTVSTKNTEADPAVLIATGSSNKWIKIGSALGGQNNTVSLGNIRMRTSPSGVEINGTSNVNTVPIFLGNQQTTATLNLGSGVGPDLATIRAIGADVNIATGASNACAINVMNGATTGGSVNIANGTGATQTTAVYIGSGSTTGAVTIGNSANTVQVNGALTMGTGKNITLAPTAGIVSPTAFTQLGGTTTNTSTALPVLVGSVNVMIPVQITRAGTYLFTCGATLQHTVTLTNFYSNIFESSGVQTVGAVPVAGTGAGNIVPADFGEQTIGTIGANRFASLNGSYVYTVPETNVNFYYSLTISLLGSGSFSNFKCYMTITRIA